MNTAHQLLRVLRRARRIAATVSEVIGRHADDPSIVARASDDFRDAMVETSRAYAVAAPDQRDMLEADFSALCALERAILPIARRIAETSSA